MTSKTDKPTTVTWPKVCKIHEAAAKERGRYAMHGVRIADGTAIATDGSMLAVIPVECDAPCDAVTVPLDIIKLATKGRGDDARITLNGSAVYGSDAAGYVSAPYIEDEYPAFENMMRDAVQPKADGSLSVTFNPALLLRLAKALGDPECVTLTIETATTNGHAIRVDTAHGHGLLMPITREG